MTNLLYSQMKPNEQKKRFQGFAQVFLLNSTLSFRNFKRNYEFLFDVLLMFWILMAWTFLLTVQYVP